MSRSKARVVVLTFFEKIAVRIQNEVKALKEAGYDVKVYNWDRKGAYRGLLDKLGFKVRRITLNAPEKGLKVIPFLLPLYIKLARELKREKFGILHCTHLFLLPLCLLFRGRARVVYDVREMHSVDISDYFPGFLSGLVRKLVEFFENKMVERVDCVFTVDSLSDFLEERYRRHNDNVEVLYNVPELNVAPSESKVEELKREYQGKKILAYIGGIARNRGLMQSLEAIRIVDKKDLKLLLIGRIKDSEKEALEFIERNGLEGNVEFIEWLPYEEMLSYLEAADIGLALYQPVGHQELTSKGNGRKIFTYMQASLPVIAPEFGERGQAIRDEKCGILVDTTRPKRIVEGINYLLDHLEEARAMGERGRKAVEERYNWEIEKKKVLRAFERLGGAQ